MDDEDSFMYDPEDCEECGCPASEFESSDYDNGTWQCPECGAVQ